jgi:hypothetical protein
VDLTVTSLVFIAFGMGCLAGWIAAAVVMAPAIKQAMHHEPCGCTPRIKGVVARESGGADEVRQPTLEELLEVRMAVNRQIEAVIRSKARHN